MTYITLVLMHIIYFLGSHHNESTPTSCTLFHSPGNTRIGVFIGVAVGVAVVVVLLVGSIVMYAVNRRWQGKTKELQVLVEGDTPRHSYGALDESSPTTQEKPGAWSL